MSSRRVAGQHELPLADVGRAATEIPSEAFRHRAAVDAAGPLRDQTSTGFGMASTDTVAAMLHARRPTAAPTAIGHPAASSGGGDTEDRHGSGGAHRSGSIQEPGALDTAAAMRSLAAGSAESALLSARAPAAQQSAFRTGLISGGVGSGSLRLRRHATAANLNFESLDFEDVENDVLQDGREEGRDAELIRPARWKMWAIVVVIGIVTAAVGFGINTGIDWLVKGKLFIMEKVIHTGTTPRGDNRVDVNFFVPALVFIALNCALVAVAGGLVTFVEPVARGSGIGEIKCLLNGVRVHRVVRLKTLCCKAFGILFSVASGLPCGKEGPMIHSGAAIATGIATGKSSKLHCDTGLFRAFRSDGSRRDFITAGSAAGVAAAFGAPIGGLLFAVEEVGSFWSIELTVLVFVCSAVTPWAMSLMMHPKEYSKAQMQGLIDFGVVEGSYSYLDFPFLVMLGIIGGAVGVLFIKANILLTRFRRRFVATRRARFIEVFAVSALVSLVLICLTLLGYSCEAKEGVTGVLKENMLGYGCADGYFNDMATYFFRGMEGSVSGLIHAPKAIRYSTLVKQLVPYFFLTVLTYGVYVPSGLFLPSLALGVNIGHLFAQLWNEVLPAGSTLNLAHFALFGGTAVLAGVVRMTISVIVIVMEATGNTHLFYPLVVITVSAKFFGDFFTAGVYDEHLHLNKVPLLENELHGAGAQRLRAADVANPSIVVMPPVTTVGTLVRLLKRHPHHNAIICVDATGAVAGLLLRRNALLLVRHRVWEAPQRLSLRAFVKSSGEREMLKLKKYHFFDALTRDHLRARLDVAPYMERWPTVMVPSTPLPRVHRVFRNLGLRHIVVADETTRRPLGIIGRKQLCFLVPEDAAAAARLDEEGSALAPGGGDDESPSRVEQSPMSPYVSTARPGAFIGAAPAPLRVGVHDYTPDNLMKASGAGTPVVADASPLPAAGTPAAGSTRDLHEPLLAAASVEAAVRSVSPAAMVYGGGAPAAEGRPPAAEDAMDWSDAYKKNIN